MWTGVCIRWSESGANEPYIIGFEAPPQYFPTRKSHFAKIIHLPIVSLELNLKSSRNYTDDCFSDFYLAHTHWEPLERECVLVNLMFIIWLSFFFFQFSFIFFLQPLGKFVEVLIIKISLVSPRVFFENNFSTSFVLIIQPLWITFWTSIMLLHCEQEVLKNT